MRSRGWAWWICGLLMLATVVNYMDRQTLSVTARRIKSEMRLTNYTITPEGSPHDSSET
jgi:MFS transporter, ACS family, hexuronate transporter